MTTPNKKRISWAIVAVAALLVAGIYSCNSNPPAEEKKMETAPAATPAPDTTKKAPADSTGAAKSTIDTGHKGGQTPPPPPAKTN